MQTEKTEGEDRRTDRQSNQPSHAKSHHHHDRRATRYPLQKISRRNKIKLFTASQIITVIENVTLLQCNGSGG